MTAQFRCYACGAVRNANENLIGHRVRCPECDTMVELPMLAAEDGIFQGSASAPTPKEDKSKPSIEAGMTPLTPVPGNGSPVPTTELTPLNPAHTGDASQVPPPVLGEPTPIVGSASGLTPMIGGVPAHLHAAPSAPTTMSGMVPPPPPEDDEPEDDGDFEMPKGNEVESEMDMTPMVDVTFLLLIFFMVTASFSVQQALPVPSPKEDAPSSKPADPEPQDDVEPVTVEIDEFNTYNVLTADSEEETPSVHELRAALRDAKANDPPPTKLVVRASSEALHHRVVSALDAGQAAKFEEIVLQNVDDGE